MPGMFGEPMRWSASCCKCLGHGKSWRPRSGIHWRHLYIGLEASPLLCLPVSPCASQQSPASSLHLSSVSLLLPLRSHSLFHGVPGHCIALDPPSLVTSTLLEFLCFAQHPQRSVSSVSTSITSFLGAFSRAQILSSRWLFCSKILVSCQKN